MNIQFGYKVVRLDAHKMISSHASLRQMQVQYSWHSWTKTKRGALAVFQFYDDAVSFTAHHIYLGNVYMIVPCIYIPFRGKPPYVVKVQGKQFASAVKLTRWYGEE